MQGQLRSLTYHWRLVHHLLLTAPLIKHVGDTFASVLTLHSCVCAGCIARHQAHPAQLWARVAKSTDRQLSKACSPFQQAATYSCYLWKSAQQRQQRFMGCMLAMQQQAQVWDSQHKDQQEPFPPI
jgi:hypothetical protein